MDNLLFTYHYFYFILNAKRSFLIYVSKNRLFTPQLIQKLKPFPRQSSPTPKKEQKTVRFFDVFRGQRKGALCTNELKTLHLQQ